MKLSWKTKLSQPPGTLNHIGEQKNGKMALNLTSYSKDIIEENTVDSSCGWTNKKGPGRVYWLTIRGLHDVPGVQQIGNAFSLHSLVLEDILNTMHRTKLEDLDDYLLVILKLLEFDKSEKKVTVEHAGFVLLPDTLLTFHEHENDIFNPVLQRLRKSKGRIRQFGADYLFYALIDSVVDNYFMVLEAIGQEIDDLELSLYEEPTHETLKAIQGLKRELITFRKAASPLREIISNLSKSGSTLIEESTEPFLKDVYDHIIQITEMIEIYREMISGMQEYYLSSVSNKMNEVMKVLTIIATIFIPLTFIVGIYGMNFDFMPELKWRSGYFFILGIMAVLIVTMVIYFKRKKWF